MQTLKSGNERGGASNVLNQTTDLVVIADEEKFQHVIVLTKQEAQLQSGAAFKIIFSQSPDGDSTVCVGPAETIGNDLERGFHAD